MLSLPPSVRLHVATQPIDGRKGVDSLMVIVRDVFGHDPFGGHLFEAAELGLIIQGLDLRGIYRSLANQDMLRDEQVRFAGFCASKVSATECEDGAVTPPAGTGGTASGGASRPGCSSLNRPNDSQPHSFAYRRYNTGAWAPL